MMTSMYTKIKSVFLSHIWLTIFPILLISSCKSFIEVDLPKGLLTNEVVFQDAATAEAAIIDVLGNLRGGVSSGVFGVSRQSAYYSDELEPLGNFLQGETGMNYYNNLLADNSSVLGFWRSAYSMIFACNSILEGVEAATDRQISPDNKRKLIGETLFLRSFVNLYLTRLFGDIPYLTTTDYQFNKTVSRTPKDEVMKALVEDIQKAITYLPENYSTPERLRPNAWVARALLARTYLYMENWEKADSLANMLIDQPLFKLNDNEDIGTVFHVGSPETIWQFSPQVTNGMTNEASNYYFTYAPANLTLSPSLLGSFSVEDKRFDKWILPVKGTDGSMYYYAQKYKNRIGGSNTLERSIQFRLAEQYFIRAESRIRMGRIEDGRQDLNAIRNRAGLTSISTSDEEELMTALLEERFRELFLEYPHRLFDVVRTGRTDIFEQNKLNWDSQDVVWPVPEKEIDLNPNLKPQNPGY